MELKMVTDLSTAIPQRIEWNHEELKAEIAERLDHYNKLVITEDTIKDGKADRASLNKLREAVDKRRKEIKKQCLVPYNDFEVKVKEILTLIDAPIAAIDSQLAMYEETRKEEKRVMVVEAYEEVVPDDLWEIIPYDRIFDQKWLNATTSMKKVKEDLEGIVKRTNADLIALDTVEEEYAAAVRSKYIDTLDIAAAMSHKAHLLAAAEAFRQREAAKAMEVPAAPEKPAEEAPEPPWGVPEPTEKLYALRLEFQLTMQQANQLKAFLANAGIKYIKI